MASGKASKAKQVSIMAITAALFSVFFFLSFTVSLPHFTLLYLPIILLGVFPLWFGWPGLVGCMIGAFIGGVYIEQLPLYIAWVESATALIIYGLNWFLIPQKSAEQRTKRSVLFLALVYAVTLFVGTGYILWQYSFLGIPVFAGLPPEVVLFATYGLNLAIQLAVCPVLLRTLSSKLRNWGVYSGNFREWRAKSAK
jgi:uncharacterized membrane protein